MKKVFLLFACIAMAAGCASRTARPAQDNYRTFPFPEIPGMITDIEQRKAYLAEHFWDGFFNGDGPTDSAYVLGVSNEEVEQNLANYIEFLGILEMDDARKSVGHLFDLIETKQEEDTSSLVYLRMTDMVSSYLYDPNSPMRSEDYYLPFVKGLAESRFTSDDRRPGYVFESRMCALNMYGTAVPDFKFKDIRGRVHSLYGVKAEYTMLFFSNPGCQACKDIIDEIASRPYIDDMIADGRLAIVNVYIDGEVDKWKDYAPVYPDNWLNGYDHDQLINGGQLYYVRAIPSLYLLDSGKRTIYKDAPVERVLQFFDELINN